MLKNKIIKNKKAGFSIIEILFYISIFSVIFLVVIDSMIVMTKSFRETLINRDFMQAGNIMERITREIRDANGILSASASDNKIKLSVPNNAQVYYPLDINLVGTDIQLFEDNVSIGNLNSSNLSINYLDFTQIETVHGWSTVKVTMTVQSNRYNSTKTETFYDTVVLRGMY